MASLVDIVATQDEVNEMEQTIIGASVHGHISSLCMVGRLPINNHECEGSDGHAP
jgi:hypothetical protein